MIFHDYTDPVRRLLSANGMDYPRDRTVGLLAADAARTAAALQELVAEATRLLEALQSDDPERLQRAMVPSVSGALIGPRHLVTAAHNAGDALSAFRAGVRAALSELTG